VNTHFVIARFIRAIHGAIRANIADEPWMPRINRGMTKKK
jgi:hypothetical protein